MNRWVLASLVLLCGCEPTPSPPGSLALTPQWQSETFDGCLLASPLSVEIEGQTSVLVASGDGRVAALDPETGATRWSVDLPHAEGDFAYVIATPVIVPGPRLVVAWQDVRVGSGDPATGPRSGHRVAVVDLRTGALDPAFPLLTLEGSARTSDGTADVPFLASNALSRSRLVHAPSSGLGRVYVSFGNARDIQPWHGWVFELDLDAWQRAATAITSILLTTPDDACGVPGTPGDRDMVCGGGVWAPSGPLFVPSASAMGDDYELIVPTGNGALDLSAGLYAHTLMRIEGPGLAFDPGCDPVLCADFDVLAPTEACLSSCDNLFVPRLLPGDPPLGAPGCDGLSFFACYAALDWDLGANSPARVALVDGPTVLVLPAKDGAVYLIDADHLGTLYDRHEVITPCGAGGARCDADWAGSMVTQPVITTDEDGTPLAIIATFMPGERHDAGLVALRIERDGDALRLVRAWEAPRFGTPEASTSFRRHPSGVAMMQVEGVPYALVVEQGMLGVTPGRVHVVDVRDGSLTARVDVSGPGQRYAVPLVLPDTSSRGARVFVPSCDNGNAGPGHLEAWDATVVPLRE